MEASLKMVLKMMVMLFAVVSTMFVGVQGNVKRVCIPVGPCPPPPLPAICCFRRPPPAKATNP